MIIKTVLKVYLIAITVFVNISIAEEITSSPEKFVEEYVAKQFEGKEDWLMSEYVKFTIYKDLRLKENVERGTTYDFRYQPFVVVTNYKIDKVNINNTGKTGYAQVTYQLAAVGTPKIINGKRVITIDRPTRSYEQIKLDLIKVENRWYIENPVEPRVSVNSAIASFEKFNELKQLPKQIQKHENEKTVAYYIYCAYKQLSDIVGHIRRPW